MTAVQIICDRGEERSGIPGRLEENGIAVQRQRLDTGDYVLSAAIAVERKASADFVGSILSGRLLPQLDRLASTYEIAVLLIEGDDWAGDRSLRTPMLARLFQQITFRANVVPWYSPNEKHTARLLAALAKEEQAAKPKSLEAQIAVENARTPQDILRSLPGVGSPTAARLLDRFGTVAAVAAASREELQAAIGPKIGAELHELLNRPWPEPKKAAA